MPGTLDAVRYYQLYLDAIHSGEFDSGLAQIQVNDPNANIALHAFPKDLPGKFDVLQQRAVSHGIKKVGASWGLDEGNIAPERKGDAICSIASKPNCAFSLIDCEGYFDRNRRNDMIVMGQHARAGVVAKQSLMIAQPWPEPLEHPGFPYEEENEWVDVNAPQYYFNDWKTSLGSARVEHLLPIFDHQWATLTSTLTTVRPTIWTIQAEGWEDIIWELITILLNRLVLIVWCDKGFPRSPAWWTALQAVAALAKAGFSGPNAVWDFQKVNVAKLGAPDGKAGPKTLKLLGIDWKQPGV